MVLVRRKKVVFKDLPDLSTLNSFNDATSVASASSLPPSAPPAVSHTDANGNDKSAKQTAKEQDPDVFYIKQTGEIFLDYE